VASFPQQEMTGSASAGIRELSRCRPVAGRRWRGGLRADEERRRVRRRPLVSRQLHVDRQESDNGATKISLPARRGYGLDLIERTTLPARSRDDNELGLVLRYASAQITLLSRKILRPGIWGHRGAVLITQREACTVSLLPGARRTILGSATCPVRAANYQNCISYGRATLPDALLRAKEWGTGRRLG
jgi:hypothetical protein